MVAKKFSQHKKHFGHKKPGSGNTFNVGTKGQPGGGTGSLTNPGHTLTYFPSLDVFASNSMDIWTGNGTLPPPGPKRKSNVNILITGVWAEGHRSKVNANDAYTHIILTDPNIEIRDPYKGNSQGLNTAYDALAIPAGQTNNWWFVVFSFVTILPDMGRRRVILADRFGAPGDWTSLI